MTTRRRTGTDQAWIMEFSARTRLAQGLPRHVEDEACLRQIISIFQLVEPGTNTPDTGKSS